MAPGLFSRVAANLSSVPSHPKPPPHAYHPSQPYPQPGLDQVYGTKKAFIAGDMYNDPNAAPQPPSHAHAYASSAHSSSSSMSSSLSPANQPSERTLSAALRGDYPKDPSPSSSLPSLGAPSGGSTYRDHDDSRMSVDQQQSHPYATASSSYQQQPQQYQQQQQPSYPLAASSSMAPPIPYGGAGAAPAVALAAEQLNQAQAALRQAEEQTRVAKMNAAVAQAKETGQAQAPAAQVKIRKTAGKYVLKDFQIERTLGTGSFGRVHLVKSRHNARFYAVKVLGKEKVVRMKQVEHTNSEREMLVRVRHPFLVNLWGTFCDSKNLYMVMDFVAGGELFSLLRKSQRFPNSVAKFYAAEVALALDYLHSLDIIYRDLKPENILLGADGHVKVTDFGFAKHVPDVTWTLCGTPDYLAPEVVQSKAYNKSVDWYALGVLIFEMLAGYPPFFTEDGNPMKLYEKIIAGKVRYPNYFEALSKDLLKSLLTSDLTKRFGNLKSGSHDIFGHEWFSEVDWDRLYRRDIPAPYIPKIEGDGDSSQFDRYAECDTSEYGQGGPDPHGGLFPDF